MGKLSLNPDLAPLTLFWRSGKASFKFLFPIQIKDFSNDALNKNA